MDINMINERRRISIDAMKALLMVMAPPAKLSSNGGRKKAILGTIMIHTRLTAMR